MPRKEFESFTRLDASDVNTFLMDQSVQSFADSTARASAITTPVEGMVTYLNDIDSLSVYNGTAFTTDRTIQVFAGTAARGSAIGTAVEGMYTHINDTDSLEYYNGSAWVAFGASTSALTLLASQTFTSATSVTIDNVFDSTYNAYKIIISATSSSATEVSLNFRVGGTNATSNYAHQFIQGNSSSITGNRASGLSEATTGRWDSSGGLVDLTIYGVALAQTTYGVSKSIDSSLTTRETGIAHTTATAYDGVRFTFSSSTGEIRIYGLEN
jgi:hypothetical protein